MKIEIKPDSLPLPPTFRTLPMGDVFVRPNVHELWIKIAHIRLTAGDECNAVSLNSGNLTYFSDEAVVIIPKDVRCVATL